MDTSQETTEKKYTVLLSTEASDMTAGAAYSFMELAIWLENNSEYHVVAVLKKRGDLYERLSSNGIDVYVIPQRRKWLKYLDDRHVWKKNIIKELIRGVLIPVDMLRLRRLFKKIKIDIVHMNGLTSGMCAEVALDKGVPIVWHVREFLEEDLQVTFENRERAVEVINRANHIIAVSEAVRKKYKNVFRPQIDVVYNGFNISKVCHENESDDGIFRICLLGRIFRGKGQLELVRAVGLLPEADREKCEVHFIGYEKDKEYLNELRDEIDKYNIKDKVYFHGYISNAYEVIRNYNCICVCSTMEAFGRTTVEGMLNGCVVIGADTGGTNEIIVDKETGLIYEHGNAGDLAQKISFCINNHEAYKRIANNGSQYAQKTFSLDETCKKIVGIYDQYVIK